MGPRSAVLGGGAACGRCHWGLRWSSTWGHENATLGGDTACRQCHWSLPCSSLWGHEAMYWVGVTHAGGARPRDVVPG
eukprot:3324873-Pyramimonas_sp.AAC.1